MLPDALPLDGGAVLEGVEIAFETYGVLNSDKNNAILICHALTGDQFVASTHPITGKPGWWERMVGPGKPIDTDRYHVICLGLRACIRLSADRWAGCKRLA
jgi:homoserine O-acetyltransferase